MGPSARTRASLAVAALAVLGACASAGTSAPVEQRGEASFPSRASPGVSTANRVVLPADPTKVSSMPSVQEAAALRPETGRRPGGGLRQPKDDPAARRIRVASGQTLYDISRANSVNLRALIDSNQLSPPYALEAGQVVMLPPPHIHVVERGETLYSISVRFNIDTRSLAVMNRLERPWRVWPGDELRLPPLVRDSWAVSSATSATTAPDTRPATRPQGGSAPKSRPAPSGKPPVSTPASPSPRPTSPPVAVGPGPSSFVWPVSGKVLKRFGSEASGYTNEGIDIAATRGAPVRAAAEGEVVYSGNELPGLGNLVLLKHVDGWMSAYAHADALLVKVGDRVRQGQVIAEAGATGRVSEPQVHFQLRRGKTPVDPLAHLPKVAS